MERRINRVRFFPPKALLDTEEFMVRAIGVQEWMPPGMVNRPAGTNDLLLMLFHEGADILVNGEVESYPARSVVWWTRRSPHFFGCENERWCHSWVHFDGTFSDALMTGINMTPSVPRQVLETAFFDEGLVALHREVSRISSPDPRIARNIFENIIREMERSWDMGKDSDGIPATYIQAKEYIDENFCRKISLNELSAITGVSNSRFCNGFKEHFGMSAIDYAIQLRMCEALYLLKDKNLRVMEVGRRVGYKDIFYFSKHFKQRFGMSPRDARKKFINEQELEES